MINVKVYKASYNFDVEGDHAQPASHARTKFGHLVKIGQTEHDSLTYMYVHVQTDVQYCAVEP